MAGTTTNRLALTLKEKIFVTPHYIRIILTGDQLDVFKHTTVGDNNKIFIPPTGVNEIHFPDFDFENRKWLMPAPEVAPAIRTYTHRAIDLDKKELTIDFVHHGDGGPASSWAIHAKTGDTLGVTMRTEPTVLFPEADWYLLAGDATAIPVLSAILEKLPDTATGTAIIEVHGPEDEQELYTASQVTIQWLHNPHPESGSTLSEAVKAIPLPEASTTVFGYVAAEFASVKAIRNYLRKEKAWTKEELYAYSYWKAGVAEDKSTSDRQQEKESI